MFGELEQLVALAKDKRAERTQEILDQDEGIAAYFAQALMLSPASHPNTLKILNMAYFVGLMVAVHFKLTFNRARPQQVYPALVPLINPPQHASYPSGHSLQSHMIALALAEVMPWAEEILVALADRIGENREIAGVHWKSDTDAGRAIAQEAFPLLRDCPIFQTVLQAALEEPAPSDQLTPPEECAPQTAARRRGSKSTQREGSGKK
jgi:acid phosphatase (class A)